MKLSEKISIYFWSIWYLKPSMVYWRIHRTIKGAMISALEKIGLIRLVVSKPSAEVDSRAFPRLSSKYHCEDIDLRMRRFSFLQDVLILPKDRRERIAAINRKPLLWQFHYGYHDYLLALLESSPPPTLDEALDFISMWDEDFPLSRRNARKSAWHPYVLSIRIESWIRFHEICLSAGIMTEDARLRILTVGIEQMTRVLLRNIESGTLANHLMRNIKALVLAGIFLRGRTGERAWNKGMRLLEREIPEQILNDGMHFERSPMYHVSMTNDILDIVEALIRSGRKVPEYLSGATCRMVGFLRNCLHPDGEIPFFNDSTSSFFLRTSEVLERGTTLCEELGFPVSRIQPWKEIPKRPTEISGLLFQRSKDFYFVFDAGLVGPDYQPGHTHCDTLSFELSWKGRRLITDTGVFHYRESTERTYSRSTAAHNTIRIDGKEQSEVWKSFRLGRRAKILFAERQEELGLTIFHAAHNGYKRLSKGLIHERCIVIKPDYWICVIDFLHGSGCHKVESYLHSHPDVTIDTDDFEKILVRHGEEKCGITMFGDAKAMALETEYYPAFGVKQLRQSLCFSSTTIFPCIIGYIMNFAPEIPEIVPDPGRKCVRIDVEPGVSIEIASRIRS